MERAKYKNGATTARSAFFGAETSSFANGSSAYTEDSARGPLSGGPGMDFEEQIREDERNRVARELHDSTSQLLVALELQLIRLKRLPLGTASTMFDDVMGELRTTLREIHEGVRAVGEHSHFKAAALPGLLTDMATKFAARSGIGVRTQIEDLPSEVPPKIAKTIYLVAQEALANASRHGRASDVSIRVAVDGGRLTLRITDDGIGFTEPLATRPVGRGITNMNARLAEVGGKLTIQNRRRGAMVEARIDLASEGCPAIGAAENFQLATAR